MASTSSSSSAFFDCCQPHPPPVQHTVSCRLRDAFVSVAVVTSLTDADSAHSSAFA